MNKQVDLNSDLGESFGNYKLGMDEEILSYVSSANIACGFHAGDPLIMDKTVKTALEKGVALGAHPAYPDLMGFGRRKMDVSTQECKDYVLYQLGALSAFARAHGGKIQHLKPHGAMYNTASDNEELAKAIIEAVLAFDPEIILLCRALSPMAKLAEKMGARVAHEVFADRAYNEDGSLVSRKKAGAVIEDADQVVERAKKMVLDGEIETIDGKVLSIKADSICVHGDNPKALELVENIRQSLEAEGIEIKAMGTFV